MPSIYLKQTSTYTAGSTSVNVTCESYPHSNLFTRYKHTFTSAATGKIYIYKGKGIGLGGFIITTDGTHQSAKLKEAHVYFNNYDKTTPLLFALIFNGGSTAENKYYKASEFNGKFTQEGQSVNISQLSKFESDTSILKDLLTENDKLKELLTYNIGRTKGDNNGNGDGKYNGEKICVEDDTTKGSPKLSGTEFRRYKHTPVNGGNGGNNKKACVIYDKNVLLGNGKTEVKGIQNQPYTSIVVYMGSKAKKISASTGTGQLIDVPLLIELTKKDPPSDPEYYVHKRDGTGYYWEQLPGDSGTNTLMGLLEDMGFGFKNGEPGYKELQGLLTKASVNGVNDGYTGELSSKLNGLKGSQLKRLLSQKVGQPGDGTGSQKTFLQLLLTQIEFDLLDSVVILLEKTNTDRQYGDSDVSGVVPSKLVPPRNINRVNMSGGSKNIQVSNATDQNGQCVQKFGYKLIKHDFAEVTRDLGSSGQPAAGIRFIIPSEKGSDQYHQLMLYDKNEPNPQHLQYTYYEQSKNEVYVYFYGNDPRPLLLCYGNKAYKIKRPKYNKEKPVKVNYTQWYKVGYISKCVCTGPDTSGQNQQILKALNEVTGFLNPVQINPTQIPSKASGTITKEPLESSGKTSATYDLHTYIKGKTTIKMGITRENVGCYDKYTYQPYGTNGIGTSGPAEGFRLGTVLHTNSTRTNVRSPLKYTTLSSKYPYNPLVGVTVYYYDRDTDYADPLLIELEFKKNGGANGGANPKEYYRLKPGNGGLGATLTWTKDDNASSAISTGAGAGGGDNTQKIVAYLDSIRHSLKKVIKILIDKTEQYELCLSQQAGGTGNGYTQDPGSNIITVEEYTKNGCNKLKSAGYLCYQHKVSTIANGAGGFDYNKIGGLKFFISGNGSGGTSGGDKDIEIKLHTSDSGGPLEQITYNTCMGDVYVFFYCKNGTEQSCPSPGFTPTAPLMLYYNKAYYKPADIDQYFTKWVPVNGLESITSQKPCGGDNGKHTQLVNKLNEVNKSLNRIKLTETSGLSSGGGSASSTYGISKPKAPPLTEPQIELNRIQVTKIPGKPPETRPYCKLVHRTMNSFDIGDIYYNGKDITQGGVKINNGGGGNITVDPGTNHTNFVNGTGKNTPNTVVAYYHTEDKTHKLPQLIVLLQTEQAIGASTETITAKATTQYGYYVLATNGTVGNGYKYEWRQPGHDHLTLNDATEFSLLNSVVVLVDQQTTYQENAIQKAVSSAKIKSPGNMTDVNRLQNKDITVNNKTEASGECVKKYGYKLFEHDLKTVTKQIFGIDPILGLRFLIPSETTKDGYNEIKLYSNESADQPVGPLYHTSTHNTVYVYFYGSDPRPLLMCFGTGAYIPKNPENSNANHQVIMNYTIWVKETKIKSCVCSGEDVTSEPNKSILNTLLKVVLFLNPVQINPRKLHSFASAQIIPTKPSDSSSKNVTYNLHQFTASQTVKMKITREDVGCYDKYTYQPDGTSSNGEGFRLGNVLHTNTNRSSLHSHLKYSDHSTFPYYPLVGVSIYYYDHDKKYEDPLLIQLDFKINIGGNQIIDYKEYYKLSQAGDDTTTVDWALDGEAQKHIGKGDPDNKNLINYLDTIRYGFKKVLQVCIAIKKDTQYSAKLLDRNSGKPVVPEDAVQVQVTEETKCQSIQGTGFRCFKHKITELESDKLHKFAALRFVIPSRDSTDLVKLNLHESSTLGPIHPLYYNCGMGDIYVYFYGGNDYSGGSQYEGDPRPLLLCYNNTAYKPTSIKNYDRHSWYKGSGIQNCACNKTDQKHLLQGLVRVSNLLNLVQINIVKDGTYTIHKFNGKEINIKVESKISEKGFCYHKYTHTHNGIGEGGTGFRMGNITYNSEWIVEKDNTGVCINSLTSKSRLYTPASEIIVYYYRGDPNHQNPLLVVLKNNSGTYKPYYELQSSRTKDNNRRMYLKNDKNIKLDTSKNGQLEHILDTILFNISNSLQINLGFKIKTTIVKYPGKSGKQTITINKKTYLTRVYENQVGKQVKTNENIEVQVSGPIDITTTSGNETGYQCYRHLLTQIKDINNFGGLRLFLWDNRNSDDDDERQCKPTPPNHLAKRNCCELDLYQDNSPVKPIAYTTCKGDLYVYFYGSDPRPMLLCYNNHSYAPTDLNTYSQKWCRVKEIQSCECSDKAFKPEQALLNTLYNISMFLNPVNLWETMAAYKKVADVIEIRYLLFIIFSYLYSI